MAHEAFGKLRNGAFFLWRGGIWMKVPGLGVLNYNAYAIWGGEGNIIAEVMDEAKLVNTKTGRSPEEEQHMINLYASQVGP